MADLRALGVRRQGPDPRRSPRRSTRSRATGARPSVNLKLFFEGEEEAGSPHLASVLAANRELLRADAWLLCDGPVHQSRRMQVVFGARGVTDVEITVYGPSRSVHSGHYGNWVPNPAVALAHLVSGLRDRDGRIAIAGFYDDVRAVTPAERAALAAVPDVDAAIRAGPRPRGDRGRRRAPRRADHAAGAEPARPAVGSGGAKAQNAIPTEARASIDFRLVPDQTPQKVRERVEAHLRAQGWTIVHAEPTLDERRATPEPGAARLGRGLPGGAHRARAAVLETAARGRRARRPRSR